MDREGFGLVQKRQLLLAPNDLCGRLANAVFKRSNKVSLIEIAGQMDGVEDGDALLQQVRCISRSLDLTKSRRGYARGPQKVSLCGSQGQHSWLTLQYGVYG